MTTTVTVLLEGAFATAAGISYTSDQCTTALDKITCTNESAGTATATVRLLSADGTQAQSFAKAIPAGGAWPFPEVVGHTLAIGGKLTVLCPTVNAIKARASGRQFT